MNGCSACSTMAERIFFEKRHGRSSILALNIFPVDVSKSAMNKFIPYLQFGKINCLLCHVSKYGESDMLHQSEDPKRKEINMIFENSVIRISNFFSNPSNSFKEGFAQCLFHLQQVHRPMPWHLPKIQKFPMADNLLHHKWNIRHFLC